MKFACGITLYNPSLEQLENIKEYSSSFSKVFLFDNSEPEYEHDFVDLPSNIYVLTENRNCGLSYAFNEIIINPECQDVDFLCTLDQDSIFEKNDILNIEHLIEKCEYIDSVGIIGPYVDYGFGKHNTREVIEVKKWIITSGSFLNLNVVRKEGLSYDLNYFIDKFEIDMCQQMLVKGYGVLMYHGAVIHQQLGENSGYRHPNHSPIRHYYLFRNRIYFNNKWKKGISKYVITILQTIKHVVLILAYEDNKFNKIRMLSIALSDYKNKRMEKKIYEVRRNSTK